MTQITEPKSPVPEQVRSTIRAFLLAMGGYMAGKGWIDGSLAAATVPMLLIVAPWAWNQINIRRRYK